MSGVRPINPNLIIKTVEDYHNLQPGTIVNKELTPGLLPPRSKNVVAARQLAMILVYDLTKLSLPEVGKVFDRDHTTVTYALKHWDYATEKRHYRAVKTLIELTRLEETQTTIRYCPRCSAFFLRQISKNCPLCNGPMHFPDRQAINMFRSVLIQAQVGSNGKEDSNTPDLATTEVSASALPHKPLTAKDGGFTSG